MRIDDWGKKSKGPGRRRTRREARVSADSTLGKLKEAGVLVESGSRVGRDPANELRSVPWARIITGQESNPVPRRPSRGNATCAPGVGSAVPKRSRLPHLGTVRPVWRKKNLLCGDSRSHRIDAEGSRLRVRRETETTLAVGLACSDRPDVPARRQSGFAVRGYKKHSGGISTYAIP